MIERVRRIVYKRVAEILLTEKLTAGEARSHSLLSRHSLAPELLARFSNGLLYRFIEGFPCTPDDLRRPDIWPATAKLLGQWHSSLPVSEAVAGSTKADHKYKNINTLISEKPIPNVWTVLQKWIIALPQDTQEQRDRQQVLQRELESSVKRLGNLSTLTNGDYVLSHTDLLSGNVIVHPDDHEHSEKQERTVSFIDYEYTTPAPQAFDLANHFAEWIGLDCDMNNIPTRPERHAFIERYVKSFNTHKSPKQKEGQVPNQSLRNDVDKLMSDVDQFRGIPGLYWGTWAIIQSVISSIDFDYVTYAETRLGEYWAWKAEVDGSRKQSGKEMPLREQRWAQGE